MERFAPWAYFTLLGVAALGLGVGAYGAFEGVRAALITGGGVFAAAAFTYMWVHALSSLRPRSAEAAPAARTIPITRNEVESKGWDYTENATAPAPAPAQPEATNANTNFSHLLGHTLERTEPRVPRFLQEERAPERPPLVVQYGNGAAAPVHRKEQRVSAVERRKDMVKDLPILKEVLGDATMPASVQERPGKTRGQCGGCETILWAPSTRPIRLRCPKCGRTATLEA